MAAPLFGVTVEYNTAPSQATLDAATTAWGSLVFPGPTYGGVQTRKIYNGVWTGPNPFPTTPSIYVQSCMNLKLRAILCYKPNPDGSSAAALQASITALAAALTGAGCPAPVICLWQEPQNAQNGLNAAAFIECTVNYQHMIRVTLGLQLAYDGSGQVPTEAISWFPGPPNTNPNTGHALTVPLVDIVAVDYYGEQHVSGKLLTPWVSLAAGQGGLYAPLKLGIWEIGDAASNTFPSQSDMQDFLTYVDSETTPFRLAGLLDAIIWYQVGDNPGGTNYIPLDLADPPSDFRIPYLRGFTGLAPGPVGFSPPAIPVFPAGYGPQPADFTTWVQQTFGFQTAGVVFRAQQEVSGGQAITTGYTVLAYDTVLEDPFGGWSATATSSQPANSWLCPFTGTYEITVATSLAAQACWFGAAVGISGGTPVAGEDALAPAATAGGGTASYTVALTGGVDYIQGLADCSQNAATDTSSAGRYPAMEITYVSS